MSASLATLRVEQARTLILEAKSLGDVKEMLDQAAAMETYARRRAAATDVHADAWEIVQHVNRRLGQLCADMPQAQRGRKKDISDTTSQISKGGELERHGITRKQASRWEELAKLSDDDFAARLGIGRATVLKQGERSSITATSAASGYDGDEYGTPSDVLDAGREALGGEFDLDPATNAAAQALVRAKHHHTKADNGLTRFWRCKRLWHNPPYSRGLCAEFAGKFCTEYGKQRMASGLLLVNAATDTKWFQSLLERFAVCFFEGRIAFIYAGKPIKGNEYSQAIFYAGKDRKRFKAAFAKFGKVLVPA